MVPDDQDKRQARQKVHLIQPSFYRRQLPQGSRRWLNFCLFDGRCSWRTNFVTTVHMLDGITCQKYSMPVCVSFCHSWALDQFYSESISPREFIALHKRGEVKAKA